MPYSQLLIISSLGLLGLKNLYLSTTTFIFLHWIILVDSVKFFCRECFLKSGKKLNVNNTKFMNCSRKHQFSIKNFVFKELIPLLLHLRKVVHKKIIFQAYSFFISDFFEVLIRFNKVKSNLLLNKIKMRFLCKRLKILCPIPINL